MELFSIEKIVSSSGERERIETHISTCNNMFERVECQYSRWRDNFFASCNPQIPHLLNDDQ